jgi:hypothetical protein
MPRANPTVVLNGDHNECTGCGKLFNSTAAFDKHRTGPMDDRRCLTEPEMRGKGMAVNATGWWVTGLMPEGVRTST